MLIGGDWGGGNPNPAWSTIASAQLEGFAIPTATTVSVDAGTTINASATERGNGGKVILWSDSADHVRRHHPGARRRAGGDGGFVETSSRGQLSFTGNVNAGAPRGTAGTLLLDPQDLLISSACDGGANCINPAQIERQLAAQNVVIATNPQLEGNGDIFALVGSIALEQQQLADPQRLSRHQHRRLHHPEHFERQSRASRRQHRIGSRNSKFRFAR